MIDHFRARRAAFEAYAAHHVDWTTRLYDDLDAIRPGARATPPSRADRTGLRRKWLRHIADHWYLVRYRERAD